MWLTYVFGLIAIVVVILSLTGKSLGVRNICAQILLRIFEWAIALDRNANVDAEHDDEDEDEEETSPNADNSAVGEHPRATAIINKTKQRLRRISEDRPLIRRQWSGIMDRKLNTSDVDTDSDGDTNADADSNEVHRLPNQKRSTVKVIVNDTLEFLTAGVEAIIEDEVTSRFSSAQLASWNLLSRSHTNARTSPLLTVIYGIGFLFRYAILLPVRFFVFTLALALLFPCALLIGIVPQEKVRVTLNRWMMLMFMRLMSRSFSAIIKYHDEENRPTTGIAVANHTSPIDVMILSCNSCYAMIGQRHGGILGAVQSALERCSHHIWFERSEARDRDLVRITLKTHVNDSSKLPILIFPEGTCINNTSVMQFKKGSFEVADVVFPIAMKYDNRLGDAFWNSSTQGIFSYLVSMMTSWALVCDVYYLKPVHRGEGEEAIDFARRVKRLIAKRGGLVDLEWDGNLKRAMVPDRLKNAQKELFYHYLTRRTTICDHNFDEIHHLIKPGTMTVDQLPEVFDENGDEEANGGEADDDEDAEALTFIARKRSTQVVS